VKSIFHQHEDSSMDIASPLPLRAEPIGYWGRELAREPAHVTWLWDGYLAVNNVTLLTSQWKSGKTTLLSVLLARLKDGGQLAGLTVRAGKAIVISEETRSHWRRRHDKLDLGHVYFISLPFRGKPSLDEWRILVDHVAALHTAEPVDLVTIDTLTSFLPGHSEISASLMMDAMLPLRALSQRGVSVLLLHHPAKGDPLPGQAARGTGALASFTDINLEMSWHNRGDANDRRRRILSQSRFEETPRQLVIELNETATDYLVHGDFDGDEFTQNWGLLHMVLEDARDKRTRQQLRADWPEDFSCPSEATLYRWLLRAIAAGLVCQEGTGRKADPFRYWLPGRIEEWKKDPLWELQRRVEESSRWMDESVRSA
jgi:hypothetical protein